MLTQEQVVEAVAQMTAHCKMMMEQGTYDPVSARSVLYTLGFEADVDQVLRYIADRGFSYCLDASIPCPDGVYPDRGVCWWGPDQLESRLQFIR